MNKTKIFTLTLLLAGLAVGCTEKENVTTVNKGHLWIFANQFSTDSKVSFDPGNPYSTDPNTAVQWVENEPVVLNDNVYYIALDSDRYSLKETPTSTEFIEPLDEDMLALYPGASFDGNEVEIVNGNEVVLHRLTARFLADGRQEMAFPMLASASANAQNLYFDHLCGGLQISINNNRAAAVNVASIRVVAQSASEVINLGRDIDGDDAPDYTSRWAVEGPWVPNGPVGGSDDDLDIKYSSVMNFDLRRENSGNNDIPYVSIQPTDTLRICVPVTISSMNKIVVTGYSETGVEVFRKKGGGAAFNIAPNRMYTIPAINLVD